MPVIFGARQCKLPTQEKSSGGVSSHHQNDIRIFTYPSASAARDLQSHALSYQQYPDTQASMALKPSHHVESQVLNSSCAVVADKAAMAGLH